MKKQNSQIKIFDLDGRHFYTIYIIKASWHKEVMNGLLESALNVLHKNGFISYEKFIRERCFESNKIYVTLEVPGTYEIPLGIKTVLKRYEFGESFIEIPGPITSPALTLSGFIALGTVIKGETDHNFYINSAVSHKIMDIMTEYNIPIGFGVITANTYEQALARTNKGQEAAEAVLHMIELKNKINELYL